MHFRLSHFSLLLFLSLMLVFTSCAHTPVNAQQEEEDSIRKVWRDYAQALQKKDVGAAIKLVDDHTFAHCDTLIEYALYADSSTLVQIGLTDQMAVLTMRSFCTPSFLDSASGRGYFRFAMENGLIGEREIHLDSAHGKKFYSYDFKKGALDMWQISGLELGKIEVTDSVARAEVIVAKEFAKFYLHFHRYGAEWKADMMYANAFYDHMSGNMIKIMHWSQAEFVLGMTTLAWGKEMDPGLWKPLKP